LSRAPRKSDFIRYRRTLFRLVEAQHRISTSRLTDSLIEEERLEKLVEQVKPPLPKEARGLHYLLATPFRYGHRTASRFRRAGERPGIFYASESRITCLTELAYWRLRFHAASPDARLPASTTEHFMFSVPVDAGRALDLTAPPFAVDRAKWASKTSYEACQGFATSARSIAAQLIRYESARDPGGTNAALLDAACFTAPVPTSEGSWHLRFQNGKLIARAAAPSDERHEYEFGQFGLKR